MTEVKKFAVVGYPAKHSKSPKIFNFLKEYYNLDFTYDVLEISPQDFESSFDTLKEYDGLNITAPYKQKILDFAFKKSPMVEITNAANVLKKIKDDKYEAFNTDVHGFRDSLEPYGLTDESALVLGSSGAARAAILGLHEMGVKDIFVKARDYSAFKNFSIPVQQYTDQKPNVVIQATTIGLNQASQDVKDRDFFNFDYSQVKISYDMIYSPKITSFMQISKENGVANVINGENMLALQALKTFDIWFGPQGGVQANVLEKLKEIL